MNLQLEEKATQLLKKHGFKENGELYGSKLEVDDSLKWVAKQKEHRKKSKDKAINLVSDIEDNVEVISGSFSNKSLHKEELTYVLHMDLKSNFKIGRGLSNIEWRMYNLIVPRFMWSGYGIYHFQFVPKEGLYMAIYKLSESDDYENDFFKKAHKQGFSKKDIKKTCDLYSIQLIEKELIAGHRYIATNKNPTKSAAAKIKSYQKRLTKQLNIVG